MGAVFVAKDSQLGRRAAVKVLLPDLSHKKELVERFFNEAKTASQIEHPSIVKIYDHGIAADGAAFIVMELLEGETLSQRLKATGTLPIPTAVAFTRQVANALTAAHRAGIIHRDLKPDNVYLIQDPEVVGGERVKLLDFGIAKLATDTAGPTRTVTGAILGTPHYMSPEQCEGSREVDPRTDLYSLGCMLFQMVSGVLPFESQGVGGLIGMHLHVPPPPLRSKCPTASGLLEAIVAQLLAKAPEERFQSAEAVAKALADPEASMEMPLPPGTAPGHARPRGKTELGVAPTMATPSSLRVVDARAATVAVPSGETAPATPPPPTTSPPMPASPTAATEPMPRIPTVPPTVVRPKPRGNGALIAIALLLAAAAGGGIIYVLSNREKSAPAATAPPRNDRPAVVVDAAPQVVQPTVTIDAAPPAPEVNGPLLDSYVEDMTDARGKKDWPRLQAKYDRLMKEAPADDPHRAEADKIRKDTLGDASVAITKLVKKNKCDEARREGRKLTAAFGADAEEILTPLRSCKADPLAGAGSGSDEAGSGSGEDHEPPADTNVGNNTNAPNLPPDAIQEQYRTGKFAEVVASCKGLGKGLAGRIRVVKLCAIAACKVNDPLYYKLMKWLARPGQKEVADACNPPKAQTKGGAEPVQQENAPPAE